MRLTLMYVAGVSISLISSFPLNADPIQSGSAVYEYHNIFTTTLLPGTPFNMTMDPIDVPVESNGIFVTEWENQVNNTIQFQIVSAVANGALPGMPPVPFEIFAGIQEVPQLGPFAGTYSNIVQDPSDPGFGSGDPSSLVSADVEITGPFAQVLIDGTILYSTPYTFAGPITSLPYTVGTQFIGTTEGEVRLQLGPVPDPVNDPVVGLALAGGVVTITSVVPEPSATLFMFCCSVLAIRWWQRNVV